MGLFNSKSKKNTNTNIGSDSALQDERNNNDRNVTDIINNKNNNSHCFEEIYIKLSKNENNIKNKKKNRFLKAFKLSLFGLTEYRSGSLVSAISLLTESIKLRGFDIYSSNVQCEPNSFSELKNIVNVGDRLSDPVLDYLPNSNNLVSPEFIINNFNNTEEYITNTQSNTINNKNSRQSLSHTQIFAQNNADRKDKLSSSNIKLQKKLSSRLFGGEDIFKDNFIRNDSIYKGKEKINLDNGTFSNHSQMFPSETYNKSFVGWRTFNEEQLNESNFVSEFSTETCNFLLELGHIFLQIGRRDAAIMFFQTVKNSAYEALTIWIYIKKSFPGGQFKKKAALEKYVEACMGLALTFLCQHFRCRVCKSRVSNNNVLFENNNKDASSDSSPTRNYLCNNRCINKDVKDPFFIYSVPPNIDGVRMLKLDPAIESIRYARHFCERSRNKRNTHTWIRRLTNRLPLIGNRKKSSINLNNSKNTNVEPSHCPKSDVSEEVYSKVPTLYSVLFDIPFVFASFRRKLERKAEKLRHLANLKKAIDEYDEKKAHILLANRHKLTKSNNRKNSLNLSTTTASGIYRNTDQKKEINEDGNFYIPIMEEKCECQCNKTVKKAPVINLLKDSRRNTHSFFKKPKKTDLIESFDKNLFQNKSFFRSKASKIRKVVISGESSSDEDLDEEQNYFFQTPKRIGLEQLPSEEFYYTSSGEDDLPFEKNDSDGLMNKVEKNKEDFNDKSFEKNKNSLQIEKGNEPTDSRLSVQVKKAIEELINPQIQKMTNDILNIIKNDQVSALKFCHDEIGAAILAVINLEYTRSKLLIPLFQLQAHAYYFANDIISSMRTLQRCLGIIYCFSEHRYAKGSDYDVMLIATKELLNVTKDGYKKIKAAIIIQKWWRIVLIEKKIDQNSSKMTKKTFRRISESFYESFSLHYENKSFNPSRLTSALHLKKNPSIRICPFLTDKRKDSCNHDDNDFIFENFNNNSKKKTSIKWNR